MAAKRKVTDKQIRQMIEMYRGYSGSSNEYKLGYVARQMGLHVDTCRYYLRPHMEEREHITDWLDVITEKDKKLPPHQADYEVMLAWTGTTNYQKRSYDSGRSYSINESRWT